MEEDSLITNNQTRSKNIKANNIKLSTTNGMKITIIFFIIIMVLLQSLSLIYLILISKAAQNLNLYNLNVSNANMYINKTESIINYVCDKYIKC